VRNKFAIAMLLFAGCLTGPVSVLAASWVGDVPPYYASTPEQWFEPELRSREHDA